MLERMEYVVIATRSVQSACQQLDEALGLRAAAEPYSLVDGCEGRLVAVGDCVFNLVEPAADVTPVTRFLAEHGEGAYAVGFRVADVDATVRVLGEQGVDVERRGTTATLPRAVTHGYPMDLVPGRPPDMTRILGTVASPHYLDCWNLSVAVQDLDAAIAGYRGMFGLEVKTEDESERWGYRQLTFALRDAGADHGIELLTAHDPSRHPAQFLARHGPGIYMLTMSVDDVEPLARRWAGDARVTFDPDSYPGVKYLWLHPSLTARTFMCLSQALP